MKVVKSIRLESADRAAVRGIIERCNMARNFFTDEEMSAVELLGSGNVLSSEPLERIQAAIRSAIGRVKSRKPHLAFPIELKKYYEDGLTSVLGVVDRWLQLTEEEQA